MLARKDKIVRQLTDGIEKLFKASGIDWIQGHGKLLANKKVMVTAHAGDQVEYSGHSVILASGSIPIDISTVPVDNERILLTHQGHWNLMIFPSGLQLSV